MIPYSQMNGKIVRKPAVLSEKRPLFIRDEKIKG